MVVTLVLVQHGNGDLHDQDGHLCNATSQRLDDHGGVIPDPDAANQQAANAEENVQAVRPRSLADYNCPDNYYANRSAIRPPTFQRNNFELKLSYFILVGQTPFYGDPYQHPMDHLERFEDLVSTKANGVPEDYLLFKLFKYSLGGDASHWLKQLPHDLLHPELTSRPHSCVTSLMIHVLRT